MSTDSPSDDQTSDLRDRVQDLLPGLRADLEDPRTQEIVGRLSIRDPEFAAMWARHDVHVYTSGTCFEPVEPFGVLEFEWEGLVIPGREGLTLNTLYAPAGSRGAAVLA